MRLFSIPIMVCALGAVAPVVAQQPAPIVRQAPPAQRPATAQGAGGCTVEQALQAEQRQDWNGAIRVYTCLSHADPRDWRPVNAIAGLYGNLQQPAAEMQWAQRASALAPQQPEPYLNMGDAQGAQKNLAGAQQTYLKAMQVAPTSPLPPYSLGALADSQRNAADAEKWYRKAISVDPKFEEAQIALAALYGNTGRVPQAIPILQKVVAMDPQAQDAKQMLYDMQHGGPKPQQGAPQQGQRPASPQQGVPKQQ